MQFPKCGFLDLGIFGFVFLEAWIQNMFPSSADLRGCRVGDADLNPADEVYTASLIISQAWLAEFSWGSRFYGLVWSRVHRPMLGK